MLVVAGGDPAKVFQTVDESFHNIPQFVAFDVVSSIPMALAGRNDWAGPLRTNRLTKRIAVISLVGNDMLSSNPFQQRFGFGHVVALASSQTKLYRPAIAADRDVYFRAESPAGPAKRLNFLPPFPPAAC